MAKKAVPATPPPSEPPNEPAASTNGHGKILPRPVEDEMRTSFIDYAMSVIVSRALPDARDGLKPVHRRILYAMHELGLAHEKPYKKSARVVGEVLGKYHPHGDSAVYDSLVRMAQDFSLRYTLVDGQGNFGSVDGDNAAAMRYTEVRLESIANELLADIDKETVDWGDNFDASLKEPLVLPSTLPNLLVNGSSGIAVGMATNIPPHNLAEVCDAITQVLDKPDATLQDLTAILKGPDFPTGGIVHGQAGIYQAYATGRGRVIVRAKTNVEEKGDRQTLIVTELPYMVNKAALLKDCAALVKDKKVEGISDLRDESDRDGMRIVIELKRGASADVVLNQLYAHTQLQTTFGILNLALVDNKPRVLTLRQTIDTFVEHRVQVITRRTRFELRKAEARLHILEGLLIALGNLDAVIDLIRRSQSPDEAAQGLQATFHLSPEQAKAILDMRLAKLTSLEIEGVKKEHAEVTDLIRRLKKILSDRAEVVGLIREELAALKKKHGDERRTVIVEEEIEVEIEDLVPDEDVVVMITNQGYIKRVPLDAYRVQGRGGKGLIGIQSKEEDFPTDLFVTNTHAFVLFFTSKGRVYKLKAWRVPQLTRYAKGKALVNLLQLQEGETVQAAIPVREFAEAEFIMFATRRGTVKRTSLGDFQNILSTGIRAILLDDGDELVAVRKTDGGQEILLATKFGQAVRFDENDARPMGRAAHGVIGAKLEEGDEVVSMAAAKPGAEILTLTTKGFGKRTPLDEYRLTKRGASGVVNIITDHKEASRENGMVVVSLSVQPGDEIICTSEQGQVIRVPVDEIRETGRAAMGVRVMKLGDGDEVMAVGKVAREEDVEKEAEARSGPGAAPAPASGGKVAMQVEETLQAAGLKDEEKDEDDDADEE